MDEMLDIEDPQALTRYLRAGGWLTADEEPAIETLAGGVSNRTVLVQRASGEAWVLKQALQKLRVATDWFSSPARIHHEALGLRWLARFAPADTIPAFVFEDHEQHILAMQAVPQPHTNWKTLLLNGQLERAHIKQFGELIGTIHRQGYERRAEMAEIFGDTSFFESLRLEPYYAFTATQVPQAAAFLDALIEQTRQRHLTLVHGDYSPKNILIYQDRLILLDHEVIHFGDPAFDLGFSLTHLLSKAHHLPQQRQNFVDASGLYWETYWKSVRILPWSNDLQACVIHHTLACLLARVRGRSPLEYLTDSERVRQEQVVLMLLNRELESVLELIDAFHKGIEEYGKNSTVDRA